MTGEEKKRRSVTKVLTIPQPQRRIQPVHKPNRSLLAPLSCSWYSAIVLHDPKGVAVAVGAVGGDGGGVVDAGRGAAEEVEFGEPEGWVGGGAVGDVGEVG